MRHRAPLLSLVTCVLIGTLGLILFTRPACVTIHNDSTEVITGISVTVQGRKLAYPDLPPGSSARRWFRNTGRDSHYTLAAARGHGTLIQTDEGYITSGTFYTSAQFRITPSHVTFTED